MGLSEEPSKLRNKNSDILYIEEEQNLTSWLYACIKLLKMWHIRVNDEKL